MWLRIDHITIDLANHIFEELSVLFQVLFTKVLWVWKKHMLSLASNSRHYSTVCHESKTVLVAKFD
jgi:hypothetical protein